MSKISKKMCLFDPQEPMMVVLVLQACMFDPPFTISNVHCSMFICELKIIKSAHYIK